jgi:hypothetical protein
MEMSKDDHTIGSVFGIVQGKPYNKFPKITHVPILQNFSSLELTNLFKIYFGMSKMFDLNVLSLPLAQHWLSLMLRPLPQIMLMSSVNEV